MDKMLAMFKTVPGLRMIGQKHIQQAKNWMPTLGAFGGSAAVLGLYFSDWKVIVKYIPYYGGKFKDEDES